LTTAYVERFGPRPEPVEGRAARTRSCFDKLSTRLEVLFGMSLAHLSLAISQRAA